MLDYNKVINSIVKENISKLNKNSFSQPSKIKLKENINKSYFLNLLEYKINLFIETIIYGFSKIDILKHCDTYYMEENPFDSPKAIKLRNELNKGRIIPLMHTPKYTDDILYEYTLGEEYFEDNEKNFRFNNKYPDKDL